MATTMRPFPWNKRKLYLPLANPQSRACGLSPIKDTATAIPIRNFGKGSARFYRRLSPFEMTDLTGFIKV